MKKPKKEKWYHLKYSISNGFYSNTIEVDAPFKNYNDAYAWVYKMDAKFPEIKFIGWM